MDNKNESKNKAALSAAILKVVEGKLNGIGASFTLTEDGICTISGNLSGDFEHFWEGIDYQEFPVRHLVIADGVTEIGDFAFQEWNRIEELTLPPSLLKIGRETFGNCHNISSIHFSEGLQIIGASAFRHSSVRELNLPDSIESIGPYAFRRCTSLVSVKLPAKLKTISRFMFCNCEALCRVQMPAELERIEESAFGCCEEMEIVMSLPKTVSYVDLCAFPIVFFDECGLHYTIFNYATNSYYNCDVAAEDWDGDLDIPSTVCHDGRIFTVTGVRKACGEHLTSVHIPNTISEIMWNAFEGATSLQTVEIPSSVTTIRSKAFAKCTSLRSVVLPDSVTEIPESLFEGCSSLREVRLGSHITQIGERAFKNCKELREIVIPDSVTTIGDEAFGLCRALTTITLPASLKTIGKLAFGGCLGLESITIPESVEVIDEEAFFVCSNLANVVIPASVNEIKLFAFKGCPCEKDITYSIEIKYRPRTKGELIAAIRNEIKIQGNRADLNCIDTSAITNMSGLFSKFKSFDGDLRGWDVSNVKDMSYMFDGSNFNGRISRWDVSNVTDMTCMFNRSRFNHNISIWDVERVERFFPMFRWCNVREEWKPERFRMDRDENSPVLTGRKKFSDEAEVSFMLTSDGVLTLSGDLKCVLDFDYYRGIGDIPVRKLILEEGITEIGELMFYEWKNLEEVTFPSSLTAIKDRAFEGCRNIRRLNFPERGLITIGHSVFSSCKVRELHLPETLTSIGSHTFSNCELLEELTLPDSIVSIGKWRVFENCSSLRSVKLPAHLKVISESMFSRCTALERVQMPEDLERIESYAFLSCHNLKEVKLPDTVKYLAEDAFESLKFEEGGLKYYVANYCTNINTCSVIPDDWEGELDIPSSVSHDGRTFVVNDLDLSNCKNLTRVRIPDTISAISERAFAGCTALRSVEIPSSVTTIGAEAFRGCVRLRAIDLPDSITEIPDYLFDGCWRLREVRLGANTIKIGEYAFQDCEFLQHMHIPDSVKTIYSYAFENCKNLVDVNMPASIESLGLYAFEKTPIMDQDGPIYVGKVLCGFGGKMPAHACLEVREGTTVVAEAALRDIDNLEAVILPETIVNVGYEAFGSCDNLKHVNLPKSLKFLGDGAFDWTSISEIEVPWETPTHAEYRPFPDGTVVYVPVGAREAYKTSAIWGKYEIKEKNDCASDPLSFVRDDMVIIGRKETYRVVIIEKPQNKAPWHLYGVIVSSKQNVDAQRAAKDLLYESFHDTALFLDWEEDRDMGQCQPLGEVIGYKDHRYAVVDLPEDASPETKTFSGKKYLTDEAVYKQLLMQVSKWNEIQE